MQNHVEAMKQYYSEEAWEKLTRQRRQGTEAQRSEISEEWAGLFREAKSLLSEGPESQKAQEFFTRWMQLSERTSGGNPEVLAGHQRAWADRSNWPMEAQRQFGDLDEKAIGEFIRNAGESFYSRWMKKYYSDEAWSKLEVYRPELAQAWKTLYDEITAVLSENPASEKGRELARKWIDLWGRSTQDDPEVRNGLRRAWQNREALPLPVQRYIAESRLPQIVEWIEKAIEQIKKETDRGKGQQ
jgi:hypothetical protein